MVLVTTAIKETFPENSDEKIMHDIEKPITLEDLTNPDKE